MYNKSEAEHPRVEHYASLLRNLVFEAGKLARAMKAEASVEEKADRTLVTAADIAVTNLIKDRLSTILKQENHILIDEESEDDLPAIKDALAYDYQWVLDPVDGTALYSAETQFWAVSLGLMRKGEPWLGAVYLPELDELYWTDGKGNVLSQKGASGAVEARKVNVISTPVFHHTPYYIEILTEHMHEKMHITGYDLRTGANIVGAVKSMTTNVAGFVGMAKIWDQAAVFAFAKTLGLKIVKAYENTEFEKFTEDYLKDNWGLKEPIIIAQKENVEFLRGKVLKKA